MKYLLLFIVFINASKSYSQIFRFKGYEVAEKKRSLGPLKESDWKKSDVVIVENFDKKKVQVYVDSTMDIDLIRLINKEQDSTGTALSYEGVDNYGDQCKIVFISYNDTSGDHIGTLVINYQKIGVEIIYRLKYDQ